MRRALGSYAVAACECMPACPAALLEPRAAPAGVQANAVLKEERGSLALEDQVGLLLQSLASDSAAVRATALQARPRPRRPPRPCARGPRKLPRVLGRRPPCSLRRGLLWQASVFTVTGMAEHHASWCCELPAPHLAPGRAAFGLGARALPAAARMGAECHHPSCTAARALKWPPARRAGYTPRQELRECLHRPAGRAWLAGLWAGKAATAQQAGRPEQAAPLPALLAGLLKCLQTQEVRGAPGWPRGLGCGGRSCCAKPVGWQCRRARACGQRGGRVRVWTVCKRCGASGPALGSRLWSARVQGVHALGCGKSFTGRRGAARTARWLPVTSVCRGGVMALAAKSRPGTTALRGTRRALPARTPLRWRAGGPRRAARGRPGRRRRAPSAWASPARLTRCAARRRPAGAATQTLAPLRQSPGCVRVAVSAYVPCVACLRSLVENQFTVHP